MELSFQGQGQTDILDDFVPCFLSRCNYVYNAGSVSMTVWSEAGSQEATGVQGGT